MSTTFKFFVSLLFCLSLLFLFGCEKEDKYAKSRRNIQLSNAVLDGDVAKVKVLLQSGADVNQKGGGSTLLHFAVGWLVQGKVGGDLELVKILVAAGADINAKNDRGETPLDWALDTVKETRGMYPQTVSYLRSIGAKQSRDLE